MQQLRQDPRAGLIDIVANARHQERPDVGPERAVSELREHVRFHLRPADNQPLQREIEGEGRPGPGQGGRPTADPPRVTPREMFPEVDGGEEDANEEGQD